VRLLAHLNVARMRGPLDSAAMRGFAAAYDPVSRIAEESPGFVWRLGGAHPAVASVDDAVHVVNLSLWESYPALHAYVYRSAHGAYVRGRARWFLPTRQPSTVLWWVEPDCRPDVDEGLRRLRHLRRYGPAPQAFGLRRRFDPAGTPEWTRRADLT
jgi:hypothetical protein